MSFDYEPEHYRSVLERYGLPEDVIDGVLHGHAHELAEKQRVAISDDSPAWVKVIPDLIDPEVSTDARS